MDPTDLLPPDLRRDLFPIAFGRAPIGMAIADSAGSIVRCNPAFAGLLGYDNPSELFGMTWVDLTHPEDLDQNLRLHRQARRGRESYTIEKRYVRRDGSTVWVSLSALSVFDDDGRLVWQMGQAIDITEQRAARQAMEDLVRAKDRFLARISHELRTPLTAIQGLAEEMRQSWGDVDPGTAEELVGIIADQSRDVGMLVEDLLVASRAETDELTIRPERVDVAAKARLALRAVPEVVVGVVGDADAWADPLRLRQIFKNLISNAARHGGPTIVVEVGRSGPLAWAEVRDDGAGFDTQIAERLFDRYTSGEVGDGLPPSVGLGLWVARTLATRMHGDLAYRRDGGWSILRLELPSLPTTPRIGAGRRAG